MLSNVKISQKIAAVLALLGAVTLVLAFFGAQKIGSVTAQYDALVDNKLASTMYRSRANTRMNAMMYDGYKLLAVSGSASAEDVMRKLAEDADKAESDLEAAIKRNPGAESELNATLAGVRRLRELLMRSADLARSGNTDAAKVLLESADREMSDAFDPSLSSVDRNSDQAEAQSKELTDVSGSTKVILIVVAFIAVILGVALGLFVARKGITGPLDHLKRQMAEIAGGDFSNEVDGTNRADEVGAMARAVQTFRENGIAKAAADKDKAKADADQKFVVDTVSEKLASVSEGDLTADIKVEFPASYAELRNNFNSALANLRQLIGAVKESAESLRTGSQEISQASEDLARRTESNAANLEETSAALQQIDGRIKATAVAGGRTVERADQAITTVSGGRAIADEAVQAMNRVRESAGAIDEVIEGVDKIAFQTRVLAMNAAVEAGRAGDAGRGFAVVADLVSALAMRAEEEAKRARDQLTVTQGDIVMAVGAVEKIDGALTEISGGVGEVHGLLGSMASDNNEQASAITQISAAVTNMDQSTQQNAAMVEETSAAARNLNLEAEGLAEKASSFRIDDGKTNGARLVKSPVKSVEKVSAPSSGYASPVKPLQVAAIAKVNGNGTLHTQMSDWQDLVLSV